MLQIGHRIGGVFSYLGELRILVNKIPQVDYTGWSIAGRLEDNAGVVLPYLTVEWVDITTGVFRARISASNVALLKVGFPYRVYVLLTTPSGDSLEPIEFELAMKRS